MATGVTPVSEGLYDLRWDKLDETGKRIHRKRRFHGTMAEAEAEQLRLSLVDARPTGKTTPTVGEWLESYLQRKKASAQVQTYRAYVTHAKTICEHLGDVTLADLTPTHVNNYYCLAATSGRVQNRLGRGEGLSQSTLKHHHVLLKAALETAVNEELIVKNPMAKVVSPTAEDKPMPSLSAEQVTALQQVSHGTPLEIPIHLALNLGMREGEVLALRWSAVHLKARVLNVEAAAYPREGGGMAFKVPKSRTGRRSLPMTTATVALLTRHKAGQDRHAPGETYHDANLVVCMDDGRPMRNDFLTKQFRKLRAAMGWPENITFHCLRRTFCTNLAGIGIAPRVAQELMGHSNITTTLGIYTNVALRDHTAATEALGDLYARHAQESGS